MQKVRAEEDKKERENEEKRKRKKGGNNGDQNRFCFVCFCVFFISPRECFFHMRSGHFSNISRLSRSYSLLFAIKILMVSQFGDL